MATITGPTATANDPPGRVENPPATPLWQAPVFVLGVAALVTVWLTRPLWTDTPARRLERDLAVAREELARPDGDGEHALKHAQRAFEAAETLQEHQAEAALLVATAHIRLAETADNPTRAAESWRSAWRYLDQAEKAGVPEEERPGLLYHQGKVGLHVGDDLGRVITRLEETTKNADNRAEGYALLTEAYLRKQPPDLAGALKANERLREVSEAGESEQAAAMLQGGELLLRLGKPEEARKSLERIDRIGERAPPAILARARLLRGRCCQEEKNWTEAVSLYTEVLKQSRSMIPDRGQFYYNLGLCYRHIGKSEDAAAAWEECVRVPRGDEGPAAAVALAEQRVGQSRLEAARDALRAAVTRVSPTAPWANPLVEPTRVRKVFDSALAACRDARRYDLALDVLEPYARLLPPRRALEMKGELYADWARLEREKTRQNPPVPGREREVEAPKLFRRAGDAFDAAANLPRLSPAEHGQLLWSSASNYLAAEANDQAVARLEKLVAMPNLDSAVLGEAWFRLAEIRRANGNMVDARTAYLACMGHETRFAYRARYQMALVYLQDLNFDEAMLTLEENIRLLRWESDPEALAQSQFTLGDLRYTRGDYEGVVRCLEDGLKKTEDSPQFKDTPERTRARFQLADAYFQKALRNEGLLASPRMTAQARTHHDAQYRLWLSQAADEISRLDEYLNTEAGRDHLTREQRTRVPFITAKCWFNLGEYEKALKIYERLIDRHQGKTEEVEALGQAVSCHAAMYPADNSQLDKIRQRLLQMQKALPSLPPEVRKQWEQWVEKVKKGLEDT